MIITATLETIETDAIEHTEVECQGYAAGFDQLRRTVPEGSRLLSVRVAR
ncbi:hypothetical protein [Arthrobacter sp. STN4]|nr:hypothetical protein [Arthrobacter sp. STN4]MCQ9162956.1 hypothetical protein [Arthrobacter sp. STN4]